MTKEQLDQSSKLRYLIKVKLKKQIEDLDKRITRLEKEVKFLKLKQSRN